MMAGVKRTALVEAKLQSFIGSPVEIQLLKPFAIQPIEHAEIPRQYEDMQVRFLVAEGIQERQKSGFISDGLNIITPEQMKITVELPAGNKDISRGGLCSAIKRAKVIAPVDE